MGRGEKRRNKQRRKEYKRWDENENGIRKDKLTDKMRRKWNIKINTYRNKRLKQEEKINEMRRMRRNKNRENSRDKVRRDEMIGKIMGGKKRKEEKTRWKKEEKKIQIRGKEWWEKMKQEDKMNIWNEKTWEEITRNKKRMRQSKKKWDAIDEKSRGEKRIQSEQRKEENERRDKTRGNRTRKI